MELFPFQLRGIDHVVLRVSDIERMLSFYTRVLGCTEERAQPDIGLFQLRAGHSLIDLIPVDGKLGQAGAAAPAREGRNMDHFAIAIEPFDEDALKDHLERHGVSITQSGERYGAAGEGPSIYISDPEGNAIELKGPPSTRQ